jgi:hypothetical protein
MLANGIINLSTRKPGASALEKMMKLPLVIVYLQEDRLTQTRP